MDTQELEAIKSIVKETIQETLKKELMKMRLAELPYISDEEQKDIDERYAGDRDNFEIGSTVKIDI